MTTLPKRYTPTGVGKSIGGNIYVHREYEHLLPQGPFAPMESFAVAKALIPKRLGGRPYTLVKYNTKTRAYTFIWLEDFDTADEPTMKIAILCLPNPQKYVGYWTRTIWPPKDPWVYHHKWLMVKDDYAGFDVEESKARSRAWLGLKNIDKSRIGKKSYWEKEVIPLIPSAQ